MTAAIAQKRIREIAQKTENVILGTHARERMSEREILDIDVFRVLREGYVDDAPELTERNEWKCKIALKIKGGRTCNETAGRVETPRREGQNAAALYRLRVGQRISA
ncbi:MAG: DUF4258 domain-containing protein [Betaproteobacteria bacterium]|nr:DUF4258 domain-containing protein [Betaproteobacteria bacterium]